MALMHGAQHGGHGFQQAGQAAHIPGVALVSGVKAGEEGLGVGHELILIHIARAHHGEALIASIGFGQLFGGLQGHIQGGGHLIAAAGQADAAILFFVVMVHTDDVKIIQTAVCFQLELLPDGVDGGNAPPEGILQKAVAHKGNLAFAVAVLRGATVLYVHILSGKVFAVYPQQVQGGAVAAAGHGTGAHALGQLYSGHLIAEGIPVFLDHFIGDQVLGRGGAWAKHSHGHAALIEAAVGAFLGEGHRQVVGPQAGHTVGDAAGEAFAHGDDGDHRADANDDAQHGEQGAHFVAAQAAQGKTNVFKHGRAPRFPAARSRCGRQSG